MITRTHRPGRRLLSLAAGTILTLAGAVGTAVPAAAAVAPVTVPFSYTGRSETFRVPDGVTSITVTAFGGHGGNDSSDDEGAAGGQGATVSATLGVVGGTELSVIVGGDAGSAGNTCGAVRDSGCGGYGAAKGGDTVYGGGGGGSSAVREGDADRVVAGGGGGAGTTNPCVAFRSVGGVGGNADGRTAGGRGAPCNRGGYSLTGGGGGGAGMATAGGAGGAGGEGLGAPCAGGAAPGLPGTAATGPDGATASNFSGGGGGGGYRGGGSGGSGASGSCLGTYGISGTGGGGGGSSRVIGSATSPTIGLSDRGYGANGQVLITYTPPTTAITLAPASSSITAGANQTYTVTATTANGAYDVTGESTLSIAPTSGGSAAGASCSQNQCTAQTVGTYAVTATRGGLTSNSATLAVTPGAPSSVTATSGSGQSATAGTTFASPLVATVNDAYGNAVPGAAVTFAVDSSSAGTATVSGSPATTGADGRASVILAAGSTAGPVTVTATSGAGSAAFLETVTPAGPARADLAVTLDGPTTVRSGGTATLTVTVKNTGPSASGRYAAAIFLPRQLTPANLGGGARYGSVVVYRGTNLASGATASYSVTVTARGKGNVSYAGAAMATTTDPKLANNLTVRSTTIG